MTLAALQTCALGVCGCRVPQFASPAGTRWRGRPPTDYELVKTMLQLYRNEYAKLSASPCCRSGSRSRRCSSRKESRKERNKPATFGSLLAAELDVCCLRPLLALGHLCCNVIQPGFIETT